jgi:hypothetical protein
LDLDQSFGRGWLFYLALASRTGALGEKVQRGRVQHARDQIRDKAARVIQARVRLYLMARRGIARQTASLVLLRACRRNVTRQRLKRRRAAHKVLLRYLSDRLVHAQVLSRVQTLRGAAVKIQHVWRRYMSIRHHALILLRLQWSAEETVLAANFKADKGSKKGKKDKKEGSGGGSAGGFPWPVVPAGTITTLLAVEFRKWRKEYSLSHRSWQRRNQLRKQAGGAVYTEPLPFMPMLLTYDIFLQLLQNALDSSLAPSLMAKVKFALCDSTDVQFLFTHLELFSRLLEPQASPVPFLFISD